MGGNAWVEELEGAQRRSGMLILTGKVQCPPGDFSIELPFVTCGKWLPAGNEAAGDEVDQVTPMMAIQEGLRCYFRETMVTLPAMSGG
jgi:hypothetical protein